MNRAKKIVYLTPALPVGGAEKFLLALAGELRAFTEAQWIVSFSDRNALEAEVPAGVAFYAWARQSKLDRQPIRQLRALIREQKPDVVFCINFFAYFMARIALRGTGQQPRVIISYHSTVHHSRKEHWLHHLYRRMLRKNEEIVCVSARQADYTAHTYSIPRERIKVVLNCVDTDYWTPGRDLQARKNLRASLGIAENAVVIILTAAFRPEKNHLGAINAMQQLREEGLPLPTLLLVGDGPLRPQIEAAIKQADLGEHIKLAGLQRDVRPFYQAADYFTLVSTSVETFSIAALEAMACGLPLLLTDIGGASEMVADGVNGYLMKNSPEGILEGWKKGLNTSFSADSIHQYARQHFGKQKMVDAYCQLLEVTR